MRLEIPVQRGTWTGHLQDGRQTLYLNGVKWTLPLLDDTRLRRLHRHVHAVRSWWLRVTARHVRLSDEWTEPSRWGRWRHIVFHMEGSP